MSKKNEKAARPGRPGGAPNASYELTEELPAACNKCLSTERSAYFGRKVVQRISGVRHGQQYNQITWHRCKCAQCGQHLNVKSYQMVSSENE